MAFQKGNPGRPKGAKTKTTTALKDMILGALAKAGGEAYLHQQATKNPTAFLTLVGRVLPLQLKDGGADPVVPTEVNHHYDTGKPSA